MGAEKENHPSRKPKNTTIAATNPTACLMALYCPIRLPTRSGSASDMPMESDSGMNRWMPEE